MSKIETLITERANTAISGHLNLVQRKKEKEIEVRHKMVCENVLDYTKSNPNVPMYVVLSVGISAGAFKVSEFNRKYRKFDREKMDTVRDMAYAYNSVLGINGKPSDVTWRLVNRYYTKKSKDVNQFKADLQKTENMDGKRGHYEELCKNLGI